MCHASPSNSPATLWGFAWLSLDTELHSRSCRESSVHGWGLPQGLASTDLVLPCQNPVNLGDDAKAHWGGHEGGGPPCQLSCSEEGPAQREAFLPVSIFWEISLNQGCRTGNGGERRFKIWAWSSVKVNLNFYPQTCQLCDIRQVTDWHSGPWFLGL